MRRGNMFILENLLKIAKISSAEKKSLRIMGKNGSKGRELRVKRLQRKTKGFIKREERNSNRDWERTIVGLAK